MSKQSQEKKLGKLTVGEFFARFPDDDACLNHIMEVRFGARHVCQACGVEGTFHKLTNRRAFSCSSCGEAHGWPFCAPPRPCRRQFSEPGPPRPLPCRPRRSLADSARKGWLRASM